jgi:hypothetical protein
MTQRGNPKTGLGAKPALPLWKPFRMDLFKVTLKVILSCESAPPLLALRDWTNRAWRCRESLGLDIVRVLGSDMTIHVSRFRCSMWTPLDWTGNRFLMDLLVVAI